MNSNNRWHNDLPALMIIIIVIVGMIPMISYGSPKTSQTKIQRTELKKVSKKQAKRSSKKSKRAQRYSKLKRQKYLKKLRMKKRAQKRKIASKNSKARNSQLRKSKLSRAKIKALKQKKARKSAYISIKKKHLKMRRDARNVMKLSKLKRKYAKGKKSFNVTLGMWKFANQRTKLRYAMALRDSLIKIQKEMLKKNPRDFALNEPENPFVALLNGLFQEAMAANVGDRCLYAGWPSTYQEHPGFGRPYCVPSNGSGQGIGPNEEPFRTWNGELKCSAGQILCNPAIFGMGSHGNGYCTNRGRRAFRNCQDQYYSDRGFPARAIVEQLIANPQTGYQNISEMQTFIDDYCGNSQAYQCRSIRDRLARLELDFPQEARAIVAAAPAPEPANAEGECAAGDTECEERAAAAAAAAAVETAEVPNQYAHLATHDGRCETGLPDDVTDVDCDTVCEPPSEEIFNLDRDCRVDYTWNAELGQAVEIGAAAPEVETATVGPAPETGVEENGWAVHDGNCQRWEGGQTDVDCDAICEPATREIFDLDRDCFEYTWEEVDPANRTPAVAETETEEVMTPAPEPEAEVAAGDTRWSVHNGVCDYNTPEGVVDVDCDTICEPATREIFDLDRDCLVDYVWNDELGRAVEYGTEPPAAETGEVVAAGTNAEVAAPEPEADETETCTDNDCAVASGIAAAPETEELVVANGDAETVVPEGEVNPSAIVLPGQGANPIVYPDYVETPTTVHMCHGRNQVVNSSGEATNFFPQGVGSCVACSLDLQINELNPDQLNTKRVSTRYLDLVSVIARTCYSGDRTRSALTANEITQQLGYCGEETYNFSQMTAQEILAHQMHIRSILGGGGDDSSFQALYGMSKEQFQQSMCEGQNGLKSSRGEVLRAINGLAPGQGVPGDNGRVFPEGSLTGQLNACLEEGNERMNLRPQYCSLNADAPENNDPTDFYNREMREHIDSAFLPALIQTGEFGGCTTITDPIPMPSDEEREELDRTRQMIFTHGGFNHDGEPTLFYYDMGGSEGEGLYGRTESYRSRREFYLMSGQNLDSSIQREQARLAEITAELEEFRAALPEEPSEQQRADLAQLESDAERAQAVVDQLIASRQSHLEEASGWRDPGQFVRSGDSFMISCNRPTRIHATIPTHGDQTDPDASLVGTIDGTPNEN